MKVIFGIILVFMFIYIIKLSSESDDNLYILHTRDDIIKCNWHDSKNLNNGWMRYVDFYTKDQKYIEYYKIDSVTVLSENWLTCGYKNDFLKYIDKTKNE